MNKALRIWCCCLVGVFLMGLSLAWFDSFETASAAGPASVSLGGVTYDFSNMNGNVTQERRYQQLIREGKVSRRTYVASRTLNEFKTEIFDQEAKLQNFHEVAELDNVQVVCNRGELFAGIVDGINVDDGVTDLEREAMLQNTWYLQSIMSCAPSKTAIFLPPGTYYFVSGHLKMRSDSRWSTRHVIQAQSNISLVGAGTDIDKGSEVTLLKPYSEASEFEDNAYAHKLNECGNGNNWKGHKYGDGNGSQEDFGKCWIDGDDWYSYAAMEKQDGKRRVAGGLDMFFRNDYWGLDFPDKNQGINLYLENANFYDFMIDSNKTQGIKYTTSGKGFLFNLFRNCVWDNTVVRNTDGTGFGTDNPINSKMINSLAEGCGKAAQASEQGGASGFGIGHGYANNESMLIENSVAIRNKNFGFFYEHQGRFNPTGYPAAPDSNKHLFKISNCIGVDNTYNFGGLRTNNVDYKNLESISGSNTWLDVFFSDETRNTSLSNIKLSTAPFKDVSPDAYYADAVKWAVANAITNGVGNNNFGGKQAIRRADALIMLWRANGRPGEVISMTKGNMGGSGNGNYSLAPTCFADVPDDAYYSLAVQWGSKQQITTGVRACSSLENKDGIFEPGRPITRAEFITMLWRAAGSPKASSSVEEFSDVKDKNAYYYDAVQWGASKGITNGIGNNRFAPDNECTREQAVTMLYRYYNNSK